MTLPVAALISLAACSGGASSVSAIPNTGTQSHAVSQPQSSFQTRQSAVAAPAAGRMIVPGGPHDVPMAAHRSSGNLRWTPAPGMAASSAWTNGLMYVSDWDDGTVSAYAVSTHQLVGTAGGFTNPNGMSYSSAFGLLAIANQGADQVLVYTRNSSTPSVLSDPEMNPINVNFSDGVLYVANMGCPSYISGCSGQAGGAMYYRPQNPNPVLMRNGPTYCWSVTRDPNDNVWAIGFDANLNPLIGYWNKGNTTTFNPVSISFGWPGDITFDGDGYLLLDDQVGAQNQGSVVNVYYPNSWNKIQTFNIQNDGGDVIHYQETRDWRIFAAEYSANSMRWFNYPNDNLLGTLASAHAIGVAIIP